MTNLTNPATNPSKIEGQAVRCCGRWTVRGELPNGELVTLDSRAVDAAEELTARAAGRMSYLVTYTKGQLWLSPRTARQVKIKPAGSAPGSIYLPHECSA